MSDSGLLIDMPFFGYFRSCLFTVMFGERSFLWISIFICFMNGTDLFSGEMKIADVGRSLALITITFTFSEYPIRILISCGIQMFFILDKFLRVLNEREVGTVLIRIYKLAVVSRCLSARNTDPQ